jgi:hypothetical protein
MPMENKRNLVLNSEDQNSLVPWKLYLTVTIESLLMFYVATFCITMYFSHHGISSIPFSILMCGLYVFSIFVCARRVIQKLPLAALMLIIPIAPLIALIIVISLIPVLQNF